VTASIEVPKKGWQAIFIEATFSDGFVASSQVYITPDQRYPDKAPLAGGPACQTLSKGAVAR
ncbi:MAG: PhoPQ-regulated protein, partial [Enterobacteriaceae bacterium]